MSFQEKIAAKLQEKGYMKKAETNKKAEYLVDDISELQDVLNTLKYEIKNDEAVRDISDIENLVESVGFTNVSSDVVDDQLDKPGVGEATYVVSGLFRNNETGVQYIANFTVKAKMKPVLSISLDIDNDVEPYEA